MFGPLTPILRRLAPRVALAGLIVAAGLASLQTVHLILDAAVHGLP